MKIKKIKKSGLHYHALDDNEAIAFSATTSAAGAAKTTMFCRTITICGIPERITLKLLPETTSAMTAAKKGTTSFSVMFNNPTTIPSIASTAATPMFCVTA